MLEANLLLLNEDPVYTSETWETLDAEEGVSTRIVRKREEMASLTMMQPFDGLIFDNDDEKNLDTALAFHRHFPLYPKIVIMRPDHPGGRVGEAEKAGLVLVRYGASRGGNARRLRQAIQNLSARGSTSDAASETESAATDIGYALAGDISIFSPPEIIQLVCMSGRTGKFSFLSRQGRLEVYIREGNIWHAEMSGRQGEPVMSTLFGWASGRFVYEEGAFSEQRTIERNWQHVIVEGLRTRDEAETLHDKEDKTKSHPPKQDPHPDSETPGKKD